MLIHFCSGWLFSGAESNGTGPIKHISVIQVIL